MTPEESVPILRPMPEGGMMAVWVIYERPRDYPSGYVLRAQFVMKDRTIRPDEIAWYSDNPDKLRSILPPNLNKLMPSQRDDPTVLETWI